MNTNTNTLANITLGIFDIATSLAAHLELRQQGYITVDELNTAKLAIKMLVGNAAYEQAWEMAVEHISEKANAK